MDRAGEELLAGAALPLEKDRRVRRGHALGFFLDRADRGRLADDRGHRARPVVLEEERFPLPDTPLDRPRDEESQEVRVDRLGNEVFGAALHRVDGGFDRSERGHHDHRQGRIERERRVEDREAVGSGQAPVGQDEIDRLTRAQQLDCLRPGSDAAHLQLFGAQHLFEHRAQRVLVLDDQDARHANRLKRERASPEASAGWRGSMPPGCSRSFRPSALRRARWEPAAHRASLGRTASAREVAAPEERSV